MSENEAKARIKINKLLEEAGWRFFDTEEGKANILLEQNVKITKKNINEFGEDFEKTKKGYVDFLLLDSKNFPFVVLEAKSENKDPLCGKEQAREYAESQNCRFVILSNGNSHYLWDLKIGDPQIITRFLGQKELDSYYDFLPNKNGIVNETINDDYIVLTQKPDYKRDPSYINEESKGQYIIQNKLRFLREYQLKAVHSIQDAVKEEKNRFLFEMATGTGKTLIAAAVIKLFLRTRNASRVLFLVDRIELEKQALKSFVEYFKNDYTTVIYKEHRNDWRKANIVISTVQTMLANNHYQKLFSRTDFQLVISDEAHRSITGNSRAVFEYFVGYKLGLTATPKDYLKNIDINDLSKKDPRALERRQLLDTYETFGCSNGIPTFRYSLVDGVNDGFLVNPVIVDARTKITTQMLSDRGYIISTINDEGQEIDTLYDQKDFEKKFISENTNIAFCKAFLKNAYRDPISNEIGKSIIFCVSQNHAAKITQILNQMATEMFPNKYNSDFAIQVTSSIEQAHEFSSQFVNNNLSGNANFRSDYKTSKTRCCVTVGMMTTGYDCTDLLNICLMRPIFSPIDFIQIKGRGTRKHNFTEQITDPKEKSNLGKIEKKNFKLFDFFANCEYFEEKFNYDDIIPLPQIGSEESTPSDINVLLSVDGYNSTIADPLTMLQNIEIGPQGMKIDRMYFEKFEEKVKEYPFLREQFEAGQWDEMIDFIEKNIFDKPEEYYNLAKLRATIKIDRRVSMREIIEKIFGMIPYFKTMTELLQEEFDKFDSRYKIKEDYVIFAKIIFDAYIISEEFRNMIENKELGRINFTPYKEAYRKLPEEIKKAIPEYIKDFVSLNKFMR